jgi:hypothetical protein
MTNEMNQQQMEQQLRQQQMQQQANVTQQNAQNAQAHAQELQQLQQQMNQQGATVQYKVISNFKDAQDGQKAYSVGESYQSQDQKRIQELLAAHVIAEEIPQVELKTTDPRLAARQAVRKAEAKQAETVAKQQTQEAKQARQEALREGTSGQNQAQHNDQATRAAQNLTEAEQKTAAKAKKQGE